MAFVIGLVALGWLIERLGWDTILDAVRSIGVWFAVLAAIDLASVMCDAGGIHGFARLQTPNVSYWRVFAAQASGLAINRLTPGNSLGEPIKVTMLMEHLPETTAVSAVVMFNVATYTAAITVIVIGVPVTLLTLSLPGNAEIAVWIATIVLGCLGVGLIVLVRRGAIYTLIGALPIAQARRDRWRARMSSIDAQIRTFGQPATRRGIAFVAASRVLNAAGTLVLVHAAGISMSVPLAAGVLSVGIIITWLSNVIPLGMGIAEGGNYVLYGALGATGTEGIVFAMVNRLRTVVLAIMGLTVMAIASLVTGRDRSRTAPPPS